MATARAGPGNGPPGWQQAHAKRYIETGGRDGHIWEGVTTLLLTTKGRRSGQPRTTPLIDGRARARTATAAEKPALWKTMAAIWPPYEEYQQRTTREIPVVILERI
jgi:hypothetical protein